VLRSVHVQSSHEQALLFLDADSAVTLGLVLRPDADAEPMERRRRQDRRVLKASPVDRGAQDAERTVNRRDFASLAVRRLEAGDLARLLESGDRLIAEDGLDRL